MNKCKSILEEKCSKCGVSVIEKDLYSSNPTDTNCTDWRCAEHK